MVQTVRSRMWMLTLPVVVHGQLLIVVQTVQFSDVDADVPVFCARQLLLVVQTVQFSDEDVDVPVVVHDSCSYSARSLTRPLCTTTGVMVQSLDHVQLFGKVVDTPLFATTGVIVQTVQFLDKVVAMPVVFYDRCTGSRCA